MYSKIYRIMEKYISWIAVLLTGMLFFTGFFKTAYAEDMTSQVVLLKNDNWAINIVFVIIAAAMGTVFFKILKRNYAKSKRILFWTAVLWYFGAGMFLAVFGRTVPAADAMSVYQMGGCIANGDLSIIHPTDSYLSYYPQQLGLSVFMGVLIFFIDLLPVSLHAYHLVKVIYIFMLCIILVFSYLIVEKVWENDGVTCVFLTVSLLNFPMIMYSSFLYGEIPGYCMFVISMYFLVRCLKEKVFGAYGMVSVLFMTLSVWLRKNMLIMLIAVIIVCLAQWLYSKRLKWMVMGFAFLVCGLSLAPIVENSFEKMAGQEVKSGVTAMSYLAMGMQEASRGPGWYNGFNFDTYRETGMDAELTNQISAQAIKVRMEEFSEDPAYAMDFYARKYLTQWADGTYASRQAILADYGGRLPIIQEVYSGKYSPVFIEVCNQIQNLIYLGSFIWSIFMVVKVSQCSKGYLPQYLGIIIVLGGLLFHMIWEANSRYIFLYGQILFIYAASGWYQGICKLTEIPYIKKVTKI